MHYQLKNGQLVPISNEELAQAKIDGADKSKGVIQKFDAVRKALAEKAYADKIAAENKIAEAAGMAKTVVAEPEKSNVSLTPPNTGHSLLV